MRLARILITLLGMPPPTEHRAPVDLDEGDDENDRKRRSGIRDPVAELLFEQGIS
jgi:hypothetical protein